VLLQDAVLLPQIGDHFELSAIDPSCEGHEQNPPSDIEHPPSLLVAAALRKTTAAFPDTTLLKLSS
jgi:hypothetical protein